MKNTNTPQARKVFTTIAALALALGVSGVAMAAPPAGGAGNARAQCDGKAHGGGHRFEKADQNGDGFITPDEVSEQKWNHIKVADANNDNKVSKDELRQAFRDGKLGHGKHRGHGKRRGQEKRGEKA